MSRSEKPVYNLPGGEPEDSSALVSRGLCGEWRMHRSGLSRCGKRGGRFRLPIARSLPQTSPFRRRDPGIRSMFMRGTMDAAAPDSDSHLPD